MEYLYDYNIHYLSIFTLHIASNFDNHMAQGASSFFPSTYTYTHDVFLSFRGPDTRLGFTGNLYNALCERGFLTFIDDHGLPKGEEITTSLLKAIKESRMVIIIFSKNYASSIYCLKELVEILECPKQKGQQVFPIFYDVDPSEVRYQTGTFGKALAKHEHGRFKDDIEQVQKWRLALTRAADLSGWHFKQGGEYEHVFIRRIVDEISFKLNRPLLHVADYPVGIEAHTRKVKLLLDSKYGNKVIMLGIYGIGGIGKSTVARAVYNLITNQFEGSCFLASVREKSARHGLAHIQETLLSELVGERNIKLGDMSQGIPILKERLHRKRVLVILDDVNKTEQLQATAGGLDWFGFGSIIIMTTRDKHLLDIHGVEIQYEVNELHHTEALELFKWNAFKNNRVDPSYTGIIKRAIGYASGLPLALEIVGSNLFGKIVDEWESALKAYERIPNRDVHKILRVSYDDLEENEKEIFLDMACFFRGCSVRSVTDMLHARGFHPKYGIRVLEKRSLIKILRYDGDAIVSMHDMIQYMGKEIVRQQSTWPENRNRLWFHEDITRILEINMENDKIEAIMLDMPEDKEDHWNQEVFGKMKNLKMLIMKSGCYFRSPKHFPNSLKVVEWWGYPSASFPFDCLQKNLIVLNLSHSFFQWDKPLENSKSLSHLIFTGCEYIRQIPDVSSSPNLIELCVDDCANLIEIHDSVGFSHKLQRFSAKRCTKLRIVPCGIKLPSLEYLCLRDCISLDIFPDILGPMEKLQFVDLEGTAIKNLPLSMHNLGGLKSLSLNRCTMLNIDALSNIFQNLPIFFPFLEVLRLDGSNLTTIPKCIQECRFLKKLSLKHCIQLQELRELPNVSELCVDDCTNLTDIDISDGYHDNLERVSLRRCTKLRSVPHSLRLPSLMYLNLVGCSGIDDLPGYEIKEVMPVRVEDRHILYNGLSETLPFDQVHYKSDSVELATTSDYSWNFFDSDPDLELGEFALQLAFLDQAFAKTQSIQAQSPETSKKIEKTSHSYLFEPSCNPVKVSLIRRSAEKRKLAQSSSPSIETIGFSSENHDEQQQQPTFNPTRWGPIKNRSYRDDLVVDEPSRVNIESLPTNSKRLCTPLEKDLASSSSQEIEEDPLGFLEDMLSGKNPVSSKSNQSTSQSETEVQCFSATVLLKNLKTLMNEDLESFAHDDEKMKKGINLLEQLVRIEKYLAFDVRQAIQKLQSFFEDHLPSFSFYQRFIQDHQHLLDAKAKLVQKASSAKTKRAQLANEATTAQTHIDSLSSKIEDLEAQLKELKQQRTSMQSAVDKCISQEHQLKSDCTQWIEEGREVLLAISTSEHAFKTAESSNKYAKDTFDALKLVLASVKE